MPDHWQETTLDSLIALTIGGVWGADPGEDEVDVPVYRQTEFDDAGRLHQPAGAIRSITYRQLASRTLEENDVLIQKSAGTPTLPGRVVLVPKLSEASSFSNFLNLIRADRQAVEPVFLFLLLQHLHATKVAFEFQRGTNIRNLDLKSYLATMLLVPPLEEQRRIVDLVGSIDTYIDSLETQIDTTRTARSGLLSELLSNPGDDWQETTLDSLIALTIGGVWGADPGEDEVDVPVYRQTEFDDAGRLHQPAGAIRSITYRQLASRTLEENDVLIQKSAGTPTLPGRVVLVPKLSEASSFSNFLNLIRADRQAVEPVFLFILLQHLHASKVAFEFQRGTNIRNLDLKAYLATTLFVPPLDEQRRIVDLVGSFDEQISSLESQVESVRALRSGVLTELLSGERLLDESYDVAVGL